VPAASPHYFNKTVQKAYNSETTGASGAAGGLGLIPASGRAGTGGTVSTDETNTTGKRLVLEAAEEMCNYFPAVPDDVNHSFGGKLGISEITVSRIF
jgi:hypothetical protein